MLGRKREDQKDGPGGKKRKKWQEESDDEEESEAKNVTVEEMEEWKAKMEEEEKQEERERQKREREAREEAERKERERLRRLEEEERERRELEEQMEEEERQRQEARREAAERAAEEAKRLWDKPPAEAAPVPVVVPALIPSAALPPVPAPVPVAVPAPAPKTLSALMQAQAAGANIAASLLAAQPAMAPGIPGMAMAGGEEAAAGDITAHVQVPAGRVKDLLGVQGRNIKALKSQTGVVKVGVLDRNDPANVEIVGAPAAVEKCKGLVNCIVEGDLAAIGNITEILDIEPRLISRLIGPRGQNISNMKDQSGAYLAVKEPTPGMGNKVVIVGFPECVVRAKELVVSFLSHEAAAAGPGPGPGFGMGMPPQPPLPHQHAAPVPVNAVRPMHGQVPPMPAPGWTGQGMGTGKGMPGGKAPDAGTWTPGKGACDGGWHDPSLGSAWQGEGHQWGVAQGDWGPPQPCRGQFGKGPCSPAVTGHGHGDESWPQESWDYGNSAASGAVYQQGPHQAADYAGVTHTGRQDHGSGGNGFDVRSQGKGGSMDAWSHAAASQEQWHGYGNDQQGGWGHWSPQAEWDERWGPCDGSNGSGQKGAAPMHHAARHQASAYGGDVGDYGHHPEWGSHM
ncbi:unnamed protein product [Symbiodinium microadriaticum]|nr:unnamed protein product [Symbiodinium sp. KB8]CAE7306839.1 unnamed protein product [Symbiodinium microadriaticum]